MISHHPTTAGQWSVLHNNNTDRTFVVSSDQREGDDIIAEVLRVPAYEENAAMFAASKDMFQALTKVKELFELEAPETSKGSPMFNIEKGAVYLEVLRAIQLAKLVQDNPQS